jgi:hypothetical protein
MSTITTTINNLKFPQLNIYSKIFTAEISGDSFKIILVNNKKIFEIKKKETLLNILKDVRIDIPNIYKIKFCNRKIEHRKIGLF